MHQQKEINDIIYKIAKKYNISYLQAENAIYARFDIARESMKKSDPFITKKYVNIRLYKFCMFYISHHTRKSINKAYAIHLENLKLENNK
jgi:hypothetical protein